MCGMELRDRWRRNGLQNIQWSRVTLFLSTSWCKLACSHDILLDEDQTGLGSTISDCAPHHHSIHLVSFGVNGNGYLQMSIPCIQSCSCVLVTSSSTVKIFSPFKMKTWCCISTNIFFLPLSCRFCLDDAESNCQVWFLMQQTINNC